MTSEENACAGSAETSALIKVDSECGLTETAALELRNKFAGAYVRIHEQVGQAQGITDAENPEQVKLARKVRLALKAERCEVEKLRKQLKEDSLRRGKAIDGYANVLKYMAEPVEERLESIEKAVELREKARLDALVEERAKVLRDLGANPDAFVLRTMDDATWDAVVDTVRRRAAEAAERTRQAEAERVERERKDAEERERQRQENIRLKAEAEAREAQIRAEREAVAKQQAELEAKLKAEREAKAKAEREAAALKAAQEKADREARAKVEAEAKAKAEAEAKAAKEEAKAKRKAARAPDCDKIRALALAVGNLNMPSDWPAMATAEGRVVLQKYGAKLSGLMAWLRQEAETLEQGGE
jgi:septal ring factor EnvC (AmiA/AmiB activator)